MILFDVGANWGTDSLDQTRDNMDVQCFAFEPTPELANILAHRSANYSNRYNIYKVALSNYDGEADFNIASHADWGISSLLTFSDGLDKTWPGRTDFYVDRVEKVKVMRFDTWFNETKPNIDRIDFFHCDTQGSDLAVLQGMGDYFSLIVEGVVEAPQNDAVKLYKEQFSRNEIEEFIHSKGYEIYKIGSQMNEDNLYFRPKK